MSVSRCIFGVLLSFVLIGTSCNAQGQDSLWIRKYQFGIYNQYDLRNSSTNAISAHRIMLDGFRKGLKPKLNENAYNISYGLFSFVATYLSMVWSHEFGHSLRAKQVGGNFKIHNVKLPIPYTTMHLPDPILLENEALSVTAGFEVNSLNAKSIQSQFVSQNGIYNEDLGFSFANRLMYPLYASIIVPRNPEDPDTWINTAGDPVHVTLPVFKNYSNGQVWMADSTVNPELVAYYNQASILSLVFSLIDPQMYRELGASFGKDKIRKPIFILGDFNNGWTYGTMFNVSPLGYELYLNNYIHLLGQQFSLYMKYGRPYINNGIGVVWNDFIESETIVATAQIEAWNQDLFGSGVSGEVSAEMQVSKDFGLFANVGYKSRGYVLGKQISEGLNVGAGLVFYTKY